MSPKRDPVTKETSLNELYEQAKNEISNVAAGEKFIVKDLFLGYEWNRIGRDTRMTLGSMFYHFAQGEGESFLSPIGKTPQPKHQQKYQKK